MRLLRATCVFIVLLLSACSAAVVFDGPKVGAKYALIYGELILLLVGAVLVLARKRFAWWICTAVIAQCVFIVALFSRQKLYLPLWLALLVVFAAMPPWKWREDRDPSSP